MWTALAVLTDGTLIQHIVEFQRGLPVALLQYEPEVYAAEAAVYPFVPRHAAGGDSLLHHALLTDNARMVELLFRMHEQPYYAAMSRFVMDGVLELVCKRGNLQHLQLLHEKRDVFAVWPDKLLSIAVNALDSTYPQRSPEDQTAFADEQKAKVQWLMNHHPEACTKLVRPHGIVLSSLEHRDFLYKLLAAGVVDMSAFAIYSSQRLDVRLADHLLHKYSGAITQELVNACCKYGNVAAVKFFHDHASELPDGLFSVDAMDAAARGGSLDVVRFLHEHRTEGCTTRAMDEASIKGHLDVVQFLHENRTEGCTNWAMQAARFGRGEATAIAEYLAQHYGRVIQDPTSFKVGDAVKIIQSAWAKAAILSGDPVVALRAAVIQLTDLDESKRIHSQVHPVGCSSNHQHQHEHSLLRLAIDWEKDAFAMFLICNCEFARASINWEDLDAAGSDSRTLNLDLVDLLMAQRPLGDGTQRDYMFVLQGAAKQSNLPFVKALLERGVPCSPAVLQESLWAFLFNVAEYLMDTYPDLVTTDTLCSVAHRGEYEYLYKLCASHRHLVDSSVVDEIFCGENSPAYLTWDVARYFHEHFPNVALHDDQMKWVWSDAFDDVVVFMWLVWRDPRTATGLAQADRSARLRLYSRLRESVPSLFNVVPPELPWCCQLRFLRQRVETGELTLEGVEQAHDPVDGNSSA